MKIPSISPMAVMLIACGLVAASVQPLQGQKKGLPVPQVNNNKNGNQNPPPAVVKKVVPRRVTATQVNVEAVPKQLDPPVQKRVEQPKLPPGMTRTGPGTAPGQIKGLAKLKLLPPIKRGVNEVGNAPLTEGADAGNSASFPPIGDGPLEQVGDHIRDIGFAEEAGRIGDLAGTLGFADLLNGLDGMVPDLGLGGSGDGNGFAAADELAGFGGVGGGSRQDGLPDGAPPSGWGTWGDLASFDGSDPESAEVTKDPSTGVVTKTNEWTNYGDDGSVHTHRRSESTNGDSHYSEMWTDGQGYSHRRTQSQNSDGSARTEYRWVNPSGAGGATAVNRSPEGSIARIRGPISEGGMNGVVDWGAPSYVRPIEVPPWMRDNGRNPGDEGTTASQKALANWLWGQHNLGKTTPGGSPKMTTHVNPGDPDYEGAAVGGYPSIGAKFSEAIAVNPDPNAASGGGSAPSARAWRLMMEDLKSGATPGPMPGGKDPRGGR